MTDPSDDLSRSNPDERLALAYRNALYRVNDFSLKIDEPHPDFNRWLSQRGYSHYALVTAYNPRSTSLPARVNETRQRMLEELLRHRGMVFVPAAGSDPAGGWPEEPGVCILDGKVGEVREIARLFEQHAIVEGERGGSCRLFWL